LYGLKECEQQRLDFRTPNTLESGRKVSLGQNQIHGSSIGVSAKMFGQGCKEPVRCRPRLRPKSVTIAPDLLTNEPKFTFIREKRRYHLS
jgi:hypothetical protein